MVLAIRAAAADLAAADEADGALEDVVRLPLVQSHLGAALVIGVGDPAQEEQRAFMRPT